MDLRITGGQALIDGRLELTSVVISEGVIAEVGTDAPARATLDAQGLLVLPGIVDIHGDAFERIYRTTELFGVRMERGDSLLLYTDGLTEVSRTETEMFGAERLLRSFRGAATPGGEGALEAVWAAVRAFSSARQDDDMTALTLARAAP